MACVEYLLAVFFFVFLFYRPIGTRMLSITLPQKNVNQSLHMIDRASSALSFSETICLFLDMCYPRNIRDTLSYIIAEILKLRFEDPLKPIGINTAEPVTAMKSHVL